MDFAKARETVQIGAHSVGDGHPTFIIAEVGQAHDGSLGMAHAYIDAVAKTGVQAVKFQTHIASEESTEADHWRVKFSYEDKTRLDYWRRMEFTPEQWKGLADHAAEKGLVFLSSPFSIKAVELLDSIGVPAWKLASGEIENLPMIDAISRTGKPVLLSTGMSSVEEIEEAQRYIAKGRDGQVAIFHCVSAYPTPPDSIGINAIPEFLDHFGCPVGLSDHSGTIYPALSAVTLGAHILELHITMSRDSFGPDTIASITVEEMTTLVEGVRFTETMRNNPVKKDDTAAGMAKMRGLFFKSVVARHAIPAGTVLSADDITVKKPGDGIPARHYQDLIGRKTRVVLEADAQLKLSDLEDEGRET